MRLAFVFVAALAFATGCKDHDHHHHPPAPVPQVVSIELEVYDPITQRVWEDVGVRVVEAELEWSGLVRPNPDPDAWFPTDRHGLVFFSPHDLADALVGFVEDSYGQAVLEPAFEADEAFVLLEVWAPGHASVFVEVHLSWEEPYAFRSVPFP